MTSNIINEEPHRRYNPLTKSWVLVSPHRANRPWQGQQEAPQKDDRPQYDPKCYLCPGNTRVQGDKNPQYEGTFVFRNDFSAVRTKHELEANYGVDQVEAALSKETTSNQDEEESLFKSEQMTGKCVVICFSPRHDKTLAKMNLQELERVVRVWQDVYRSAVADPEIGYCLTFENKGAAMGCSNPHPHGQAWMTSVVPEEPAAERASMAEYWQKKRRQGAGMLGDYVEQEVQRGERVVFANAGFAAVVPYWAVWPFEVLVVARRAGVTSVVKLQEQEVADLAEVLSQVAIRYDNIFQTNFPYSMGLHQAPTTAVGQGAETEEGADHLHLHFYPPLLRSATVKKFLVGFEMLGMPQRDLTPEKAANILRGVSGTERYE